MEIIIQKAKNPNKKFEAIFGNKTVPFGASRCIVIILFTRIHNERKDTLTDIKKHENWTKSGVLTPGCFHDIFYGINQH
jgi:hypothetical protein